MSLAAAGELTACQDGEDIVNLPNVDQKRPPRVDGSARGPALSAISDLDLMSAVHSDACVLLTGKERAVRAVAARIHSLSGWRQGPLTIVNCGWPAAIVERVLFEECTDAGSATVREPHPRLAQAGTILLQDVGRLRRQVQSRLADRLAHLRGERPSGSARCRLMASTSEPLLPLVLDGRFDDRLYYRLNVIHLVLSCESDAAETRGVPDVGEALVSSRIRSAASISARPLW
jgi:DNA-binding NtrC family response regulator